MKSKRADLSDSLLPTVKPLLAVTVRTPPENSAVSGRVELTELAPSATPVKPLRASPLIVKTTGVLLLTPAEPAVRTKPKVAPVSSTSMKASAEFVPKEVMLKTSPWNSFPVTTMVVPEVTVLALEPEPSWMEPVTIVAPIRGRVERRPISSNVFFIAI